MTHSQTQFTWHRFGQACLQLLVGIGFLASSTWLPPLYAAGILFQSSAGLFGGTPSKTVGIGTPIGRYAPFPVSESVVIAAFGLLGTVLCYTAIRSLIQISPLATPRRLAHPQSRTDRQPTTERSDDKTQ